jgi:outer membrane beta-barrel protein
VSRMGSIQTLLLVSGCLWGQLASAKLYYRSDESPELVQNKKYTKANRFELNVPDLGMILNQSFIDSTVLHGNFLYHVSETWGFGLDALFASNQDKPERHCVEHFYNDSHNLIPISCANEGEDPEKYLYDSKGKAVHGANFGPAYMPIREIHSILLGTAVWSPLYGKQLALFSQTLYFDLFFTLGAGITQASFYPESPYLRDGKLSRGANKAPLPTTGCASGANYPGICPKDPNLYNNIGKGGRPPAQSESLPTVSFGVGQKFHFKERFNFHIELRDYAFQSPVTGFTNVFTLWGGLGVRL